MAGAQVAIIMGSDSDWPTMKQAADVLESLGVTFTKEIVSAHRTPEKMVAFAKNVQSSGYSVVIAGAGGAAHLPGMVASLTTLPVIGVPVPLAHMDGLDSLLSIVQMPTGIPVATVAIGGAKNAGYLAARILAVTDSGVRAKLEAFHATQTQSVLDKKLD
jgi:5-(carboxyamino)imidazole ribonucleotide mutase